MKLESNTQLFPSRSAAQTVIGNLEVGYYCLSHGEYSSPHYTVRKVRGKEDSYYIHASRKFYSGTFNARPSGALTWEDIFRGFYLG